MRRGPPAGLCPRRKAPLSRRPPRVRRSSSRTPFAHRSSAQTSLRLYPPSHPDSLLRKENIKTLHNEAQLAISVPGLVAPLRGPVVVCSGMPLPCAVYATMHTVSGAPLLQRVDETWGSLHRRRGARPAALAVGVGPPLYKGHGLRIIRAFDVEVVFASDVAGWILAGHPNIEMRPDELEHPPAALLLAREEAGRVEVAVED